MTAAKKRGKSSWAASEGDEDADEADEEGDEGEDALSPRLGRRGASSTPEYYCVWRSIVWIPGRPITRGDSQWAARELIERSGSVTIHAATCAGRTQERSMAPDGGPPHARCS